MLPCSVNNQKAILTDNDLKSKKSFQLFLIIESILEYADSKIIYQLESLELLSLSSDWLVSIC